MEQRNLVCRACGDCCIFEQAEHRLYASTGELTLLTSVPPPQPPAILRCAYQRNSVCSARDRRPLGCRIYFCEDTASLFIKTCYEEYHREIGLLHNRHDVPYRYVEVTEGTRLLHEQISTGGP
jgi:hypothetical protein